MSAITDLLRQFRSLFVWWTVVEPWNEALRVRLGKSITSLGPGLHWKIPNADKIYRQSNRRRVSLMPMQTLTTSDGKTLTMQAVMGYAIVDLRKLYDTLHHAEATLQNLGAAAIAEYVTGHESEQLTADVLSDEIVVDMSEFGIGPVEFNVVEFAFVRTYRLIGGEGWDWTPGDNLDTRDPDEEDY